MTRQQHKLKNIGQSCLFYGEVIGFVVAWVIALTVVARQPATDTSVTPNQFAAASELPASP